MLENIDTQQFMLKRTYLSEEVANLIKEQIFALKYTSGSRLIVETLAQELRVSMTPIREGLKILVSQGLVVYNGKSYSVFNPSDKDIQNLFYIRRYLEKLSAFQAAENITQEQIKALKEKYEDYKNNKDAIAGFADLLNMDMWFHEKLAEATGNWRLKTMLKPVQEQCWLIRRWGFANFYSREIAERTVKEHLYVLESIIDKKPEEAEQRMHEHIIQGEKRTFETLKE